MVSAMGSSQIVSLNPEGFPLQSGPLHVPHVPLQSRHQMVSHVFQHSHVSTTVSEQGL